MGQVIHSSVIVSSLNHAQLGRALRFAKMLMPNVSDLIPYRINGGASFVITPSGSKVGWPEDEAFTAEINAFLGWVKNNSYDDGSNALDVCVVKFGEIDEPVITQITNLFNQEREQQW